MNSFRVIEITGEFLEKPAYYNRYGGLCSDFIDAKIWRTDPESTEEMEKVMEKLISEFSLNVEVKAPVFNRGG